MEKTHWKTFVNPLYIGAYTLEGKDLTVKITAVKREMVKGEGGKEETCTVAYLEGQKPFIVNRTNAKTITRVTGSPYIEDWIGKSVTLFPTTTKVAGDVVECLRVRATVPALPKTDNTKIIAALRACATLDDLQAKYTALTKQQQLDTVSVKDEMKTKLSAK
jgi:hypothetical protein